MPWKKTPEYMAHGNMLARCYNHKNPQYRDYGGRGICVCDRWIGGSGDLTGYQCFLSDMGPKPSNKHSLERIDNDLDYAPENCRWATKKEQQANRRNSKWVTYRGQEMPLADAARIAGVVRPNVASSRIRGGWSVEEAVETPLCFTFVKQSRQLSTIGV